jgi:hypothetical protein
MPQRLVAEKEKHPSKDLISDAIQQQASLNSVWKCLNLKSCVCVIHNAACIIMHRLVCCALCGAIQQQVR